MQASRALRFLAFVARSGAARGPPLGRGPALVVDVDTGRVIHAERATDPWYPASVTKLMTAYVALDLVRQGRASMDQLLTVTPGAAAQPPSKMGFKPGIQLTLDNALKIIMVKSANDVAQTIAENLGGSVEGFAALMNDASARLGMAESRWVNPHGLPDERQWTSARDMAILGRALLRDFPGAPRPVRDRRDQVRPPRHGEPQRADGPLRGRGRDEDGLHLLVRLQRGGERHPGRPPPHHGGDGLAQRRPSAPSRRPSCSTRASPPSAGAAQSLEVLPPSALAAPPDHAALHLRAPRPDPGRGGGTARRAPAPTASTGARKCRAGALAFASIGSTPGARPQLGPRARFEPIVVWTGRTPPSAAVAAQDDKESARPAGAKLKQKRLARAAKPASVPPAAQAFAATEPKSIINEPGEKPKAVQPAAALTPKPAAPAKPKTAAVSPPTAKPAPPSRPAGAARAATADPAGGAKPATAAKPKPAPRPQAKASEAKKVQAAAVAKAKQASEAKPKTE